MDEFIHQFGIDWRLLLAQVANFVLLLFILKRYAYKPVLRMLEERRKKIEEGIRMREEAERELRATEEARSEVIREAETEARAIVTKGEALGKERTEVLVAEAQKKTEEMMADAKRRAEEEKRIAAEAFSKEASQLLRDAVARVVASSPDAIDKELVDRALRESGRVS